VDQLRGMLLLRRAELERDLQRQRHHLTGVEARLRHIAQEDDMPADDIVVKKVPPLGVVDQRHCTGVGYGGDGAGGEPGQGEVR
jgi:hypothetical protein